MSDELSVTMTDAEAAAAAVAAAAAPAAGPVVPVVAEKVGVAGGRREGDRAFGVGRRKTAVVRVLMRPGSGKVTVNGREPQEYFRRQKLLDEIGQPFVLTNMVKRFDVEVNAFGSSLASQAGALRLALSRALAAWQPEFRAPLATNGLLTRDPRMVERKKYGIRGARRRPQWVKR